MIRKDLVFIFFTALSLLAEIDLNAGTCGTKAAVRVATTEVETKEEFITPERQAWIQEVADAILAMRQVLDQAIVQSAGDADAQRAIEDFRESVLLTMEDVENSFAQITGNITQDSRLAVAFCMQNSLTSLEKEYRKMQQSHARSNILTATRDALSRLGGGIGEMATKIHAAIDEVLKHYAVHLCDLGGDSEERLQLCANEHAAARAAREAARDAEMRRVREGRETPRERRERLAREHDEEKAQRE